MKPRSVGGLEPDENEQLELINYYHLARTALCDQPGYQYGSPLKQKTMRIDYAVSEFVKAHPDVARKWPYVWLVDEVNMKHGSVPITPGTYLPERSGR